MVLPLSLTSYRVGLGFAAALGLSLSATKLLGIHGVESALALGICLPPLCALIAARVVVSERQADPCAQHVAGLLQRVCLAAFSLWAVPTLVLALNAARIKQCDPLTGLAFMLLGPMPGCLLGALAGTLIAATTERPRIGTLLSVAPPMMGLVLWGAEFYRTPAVFSYGSFFGYFPGSIYDEVVKVPWTLGFLRAQTLCLGLAILWLLLAYLEPGKLKLQLRPRSRGLVLASAAALASAVTIAGNGARLGLRSSHEHIASNLGGYLRSARCELFLPREMRDKERFGRDCDTRVQQMEAFLGLRQPVPVRVYVFRSSNEKRLLMGAAGTNIAKPWRNEIYLQEGRWPHPVMAHEIAHVVAGQTGIGPFRITGALGGLWPNPGLVEGMAVAAAFRPRDGLTPHQWARAMVELDMVPPLSDLLGAGFLGQSSRRAYTLAGSFLRFIYEQHGNKALAAIYRRGDVTGAIGKPLAELATAWRRRLANVELPNEAVELARLRFARGSLFSATCPHRVAALRSELSADLSANDDRAARDTCRAILEVDPAQVAIRAKLIGVLLRMGEVDEAMKELASLESPPRAGEAVIARARHQLADAAFRAGDLDKARERYRELLASPLSLDERRLVEVKALGLEGSSKQAELVFSFLLGDEPSSTDGATAVHLLRELRATRSDGLPHYLEARQLYFRERYPHSARLLAEAKELGLPTESLILEALRVQAIASYGAGDRLAARSLFAQLEREGTPALRWEASDWLQRIDLARQLP